jgi:hypothetical protein
MSRSTDVKRSSRSPTGTRSSRCSFLPRRDSFVPSTHTGSVERNALTSPPPVHDCREFQQLPKADRLPSDPHIAHDDRKLCRRWLPGGSRSRLCAARVRAFRCDPPFPTTSRRRRHRDRALRCRCRTSAITRRGGRASRPLTAAWGRWAPCRAFAAGPGGHVLSKRSAVSTATVAWPVGATLWLNARSRAVGLPASEAPGGSSGVTIAMRTLVVARGGSGAG